MTNPNAHDSELEKVVAATRVKKFRQWRFLVKLNPKKYRIVLDERYLIGTAGWATQIQEKVDGRWRALDWHRGIDNDYRVQVR